MERPEKDPGEAGRAKRLVGGLGIFAALKAMEKHAETQDEPEIISGNARVRQLSSLAVDLAKGDRTDAECVRTLVDAAGRKQRDLSKAAAVVRFGGAAKVDRISDRANRLLLAAFSGEPVQPVPPEQDRWFARVDQIRSIPVEEAYPLLVKLQPALGDLEDRFHPRAMDERERDELWNQLIDAITPLVGPDAISHDPLVLSKPAYEVARLHLALRSGLLQEIDYGSRSRIVPDRRCEETMTE